MHYLAPLGADNAVTPLCKAERYVVVVLTSERGHFVCLFAVV